MSTSDPLCCGCSLQTRIKSVALLRIVIPVGLIILLITIAVLISNTSSENTETLAFLYENGKYSENVNLLTSYGNGNSSTTSSIVGDADSSSKNETTSTEKCSEDYDDYGERRCVPDSELSGKAQNKATLLYVVNTLMILFFHGSRA